MIVKFMFILSEVAVSLAHSSRFAALLILGGVVLAGCTGGDGTDDPDELVVPDTYSFESRFTPGTSSVAYTGQVLRQVLITDMKSFIGGLTARIDGATFTPGPGDVRPKEWSEMKGFSLELQFNPRSPLTDAQFAQIQTAFGDKPALTAGEAAAYATALRDARAVLATAYGFAPENVGDAAGLGGW